jgi:S-adenosylmethionine:tRNA ribosyltransferase-isomerase
MKTNEFFFELPADLIAQYPLATRSASRLLVYNRSTGKYEHSFFNKLMDFLEPGDLLIMNDSKVIPARLYGQKSSGGKVELLVERILHDNQILAHIKASKAPKAGSLINILSHENSVSTATIEILGKKNDLYHAVVNGDVEQMLHEHGHIPLPGYLGREDEDLDVTRYQTVYARNNGSVAAPTAGLHMDEDLLHNLAVKGIQLDYVTLHVGAGTFRPVRCENINDHVMHAESFRINENLCTKIAATKAAGKRVIAVGTTALRCLESAAIDGELKACSGETTIFITPGSKFNVCDGLITNFHLPESTLLMLVSAFIGHKTAMNLYQEAIAQRYRFYSYGDASLLL